MVDKDLFVRSYDVIRRIVRWKWFGLLNSVFVFALLSYVLTRRFEGLDFSVSIAKVKIQWLAAGILASVVTILAVSLRTRDVLRRESGLSVSFASVARLQFVALFITFALPISIAGDIARIGMFRQRYNLPFETCARVVVFDRILGALGIVIVGVITFGFQPLLNRTVQSLESFEIAILTVTIVFIVTLIVLTRLGIVVRAKKLQLLFDWMSTLGRYFHDPVFIIKQCAYALLYVGAVGVSMLFLGWGLDVGVLPLMLLTFTPIILFVNNLPFLYAGWGGRELIVVVTLSGIGGMPANESLLLSVAYGLAVLVASLPGAFFWITRPTFRKAFNDMEARMSDDHTRASRNGS